MTSTLEGFQAPASPEGYRHHDKKQLQDEARRGCPLCTILLQEFSNSWLVQHPHETLSLFGTGGGGNSSDPFDSEHPLDNILYKGLTSKTQVTLATFVAPGDPAEPFIRRKTSELYLGCQNYSKAAQAWIQDCQDHHQGCPSNTNPVLPARIIEVASEDREPVCRLKISAEGEQEAYATLSYCWGGPQEIKTTTATPEAKSRELNLRTLPQTIRDAIVITRSLGLRYLWVDCLCIVQDSVSDKMIQIQSMGTIYKSATVTIAAADAEKVADGFLSPWPSATDCQLPFRLPSGDCGTVLLKRLFLQRHFPWTSTSLLQVADGPLNSRGWALQEALLSPRRLIYTQHGIVLKCQGDFFGSSGKAIMLSGTEKVEYIERAIRLPPPVFGSSYDRFGGGDRDKQPMIWASMVEDFTSRYLTFSEDRLLAIAGVARELAKVWKDVYLAGMWRSCLVQHLLWRPRDSQTQLGGRGTRSHCNAPSWSWALLDGEANLPQSDSGTDARLLQCHFDTSPEALFGQVLEQRIVFKAKTLKAVEVAKAHAGWFDKLDQHSTEPICQATYLLLQTRPYYEGLILRPVNSVDFVRIGLFSVNDQFSSFRYRGWSDAPRRTISIV